MKKRPLIVFHRVAGYVAIGYLICAIAARLLSGVGVLVPLAPFYWSLPGALAGAATYAAWTGLRGKRQHLMSMVLAGAAGVLLTGFALVRLPATIRPFSEIRNDSWAFFGTAVYSALCDLSAIVFVFALFLAGFVPVARARLFPPPHTRGASDH